MKKKQSTAKSNRPRRKVPPAMKWQTGAYERHADFHFILPYQFLLLCKLADVTPDQILTDFMDNLAGGGWKREGRDRAKEKLVEYFIEHGYGQEIYSTDDIRTMFKEMDAVGLLWPENAEMELIDLYSAWRNKHHTYWFKKWFRKPRRKLS